MDVKDINKIIATDEIVKVEEHGNCLIFYTPSRRFGIFGCHCHDDVGVEIKEIPYLTQTIHEIIAGVAVRFDPNNTESDRMMETIIKERLAQRFPHGDFDWSCISVYVDTKQEQIDRGELTGYVVVLYDDEFRVVYAFIVSPGSTNGIPNLTVNELINEYPDWA